MTAVEFLANVLSQAGQITKDDFDSLVEQAKDIELKNLLSAQSEAYLRGYNDGQKSNL